MAGEGNTVPGYNEDIGPRSFPGGREMIVLRGGEWESETCGFAGNSAGVEQYRES